MIVGLILFLTSSTVRVPLIFGTGFVLFGKSFRTTFLGGSSLEERLHFRRIGGSLNWGVFQQLVDYGMVDNISTSVSDYVGDDGDWDMLRLGGVLPPAILDKVQALVPPVPLNIFKFIWQWHGPQRVKTLMWKIAENALLTNVERYRRHILEHARCPRCLDFDETPLHILRDCWFAKKLWSHFVPSYMWLGFAQMDLQSWIDVNLSSAMVGYSKDLWALTFGIILDQLWMERNQLVFEKEANSEDSVWRRTIHIIDEVKEVFGIGRVVGTRRIMNHDNCIKWNPPP
ncbi:Reverse transcriptase zinc-binding domain [Sesbania bispinosa]|nr:Reverse transcriptase zinc-binding domain [Sesbania bispinosa]